MPLDSDAPNADALLHVEFFEFQREPHKGQPFVRIMTPGDKTSIIEQPAADHYKRRFQRQWLSFQAATNAGSVIGTTLESWHQDRPDQLTDGQLMELQILKFQTVEQVAQASDAQIQRVGMGAAGLRERARNYIVSRNASIAGDALNQNKSEIEELKAMVASLTAQIHTKQPEQPAPKRRGPKPGFKRKVPNAHHDASTGAAGHE